MSDAEGLTLPRNAAADLPAQPGRHDRPALVAFVEDSATETALREGLTETGLSDIDIRRGGIKAAISGAKCRLIMSRETGLVRYSVAPRPRVTSR